MTATNRSDGMGHSDRGTPASMRFAVLTNPGVGHLVLGAIASAGLDPALVVTADPRDGRKRGRSMVARFASRLPARGRRGLEAALLGSGHDTYRMARDLGWPVAPSADVGRPDFVERLRSLELDVLVVFGFRMLSGDVLATARHGAIGFHPSLLPQHRGASPLFWTLMSGELATGYTIFRLDEGVDSGAVIEQVPVTLSPLDDTTTAIIRMSTLAAKSIVRLLLRAQLGEGIPAGHRQPSAARPEPRAKGDACAIGDSCTTEEVARRVSAGLEASGAPVAGGGRALDVVGEVTGAADAPVALARSRKLVPHRAADGRRLWLLTA